MKQSNKKELVLEVQKDGYRKLIYRTTTSDGSILFLEESNLLDFSRPICDSIDYNVFFNERGFWKSFTQFTSNEGLLNRQTWHESAQEWLELKPVFIHTDIKHLIKKSVAQATRETTSKSKLHMEGVRTWLRKLSHPVITLQQEISTTSTYRHAV